MTIHWTQIEELEKFAEFLYIAKMWFAMTSIVLGMNIFIFSRFIRIHLRLKYIFAKFKPKDSKKILNDCKHLQS